MQNGVSLKKNTSAMEMGIAKGPFWKAWCLIQCFVVKGHQQPLRFMLSPGPKISAT